MNLKERTRKELKETKELEHLNRYQTLCAKFKKQLRGAHCGEIKSIEANLIENPRDLWGYVNTKQ